MKSRLVYFSLTLTLLLNGIFLSSRLSAQEPYTIRKVVLDPGHGGKDAGTSVGKILEKDIVLDVAFWVGKLINQHLPEVEVIYTRKTDVLVDLGVRGEIANKAKADLFISIHVDAQDKGTSANGNSSWILGFDKGRYEQNLTTVMRENDVIVYEEDYKLNYMGYTPGDVESLIMFNMMQYAYQDQSTLMASLLQKNYTSTTGLNDRGVRQNIFLVLTVTAMPSVLTEIGFMTNEKDRKFLTSDAGKDKVARAIFNAFSEYKSITEGNANILKLDEFGNRSDGLASAPSAARATAIPSQAVGTPSFVTAPAGEEGIVFCVQVSASKAPLDIKSRSRFGNYAGKIKEKKIGTYYKYYVGETRSYREALSLQREVRKKFSDAFIVAFENGEPVTITERMKST